MVKRTVFELDKLEFELWLGSPRTRDRPNSFPGLRAPPPAIATGAELEPPSQDL